YIMVIFSLKSSLLALIWTPQQSGTTFTLQEVKFVNEKIGWIAGGYTGGAADGIILRTTDGGNTWINKTPSGLNLDVVFDIAPIDSLICHAVARDTSGNHFIIKTTDGGNNWAVKSDGLGTLPVCIDFVDMYYGWTAGELDYDPQRILHTTDGGETWFRLPGNGWEDYNGGPTRILFLNHQKGFVSGGTEDSPTTRGYIMGTTDEGYNWLEVYHWGSVIPYTWPLVEGICFIDSIHGWACGSLYGATPGDRELRIAYSADGGQNFDEILLVYPNDLMTLEDIEMITLEEGFVVGRYGRIWHTKNNWDTYFYDTTNTTATLYSLDFAISGDTAYGWAVGSGGTILHCRVPMGVKIIEKEKELIKSYILFPITKDRSLSALPKKEIYSINGRKVEIMNKRTLPKGIYFLNSQKEGKEIAKFKLIKF
ncbi:MAG: YCF48-related protein, partial [candidate division WOR-3 bacterium]